jgi:23S rRNA pseudouridine1911/1915/1917 synthase
MPAYEFTVTNIEHGQRLDSILASLPEVESRAQAVRLIEGGSVAINGGNCTAKKRILVTGDVIAYHVTRVAPQELQGEAIDLDIRFEDEYLIVLSKPAGLVVHPAIGHESGTLVNALIAHCGYDGLSQLQGEERPGIVHRLDKDTSGLMIVAKNDEAAQLLKEAIQTRNVDRRYLTLVHGYIAPETGMVDAPIGRHEKDRVKRAVTMAPGSREAITTFKVLERYEAGRFDDGYTLLECKLYTGRTHQIRVHMEYIDHPCVGDPLYGPQNRPKAQLGLMRQFLHSWRLSFDHPITGEAMAFEDGLPLELQEALDSIACLKM